MSSSTTHPPPHLGQGDGFFGLPGCPCAPKESAYSATAHTAMKGRRSANHTRLRPLVSMQVQDPYRGSIPSPSAASRTWPGAPPRRTRQVHVHSQTGMPNGGGHSSTDPAIPSADSIAGVRVSLQLLWWGSERILECALMGYDVRHVRCVGGGAGAVLIARCPAFLSRHVAYPLLGTISAGCLALVFADGALHMTTCSPTGRILPTVGFHCMFFWLGSPHALRLVLSGVDRNPPPILSPAPSSGGDAGESTVTATQCWVSSLPSINVHPVQQCVCDTHFM